MSDNVEEERKNAQEQVEHLRDVTTLKQNYRVKLFLYANLAFILAVAVFLFIFFSIPDGGPTKPTISYGRSFNNSSI